MKDAGRLNQGQGAAWGWGHRLLSTPPLPQLERPVQEWLQSKAKGTLLGGTASYQDVFNGTIGSIGIQVRQAEASLETQTALRDQAEQSLNSIAGVNLDEEAANLLKYQQAYQASAQVVVAANQMFQTLLDAFR